jgi:hypothetical protein
VKRIERCEVDDPSASGLVKGVGPVLAKKLVERFNTES